MKLKNQRLIIALSGLLLGGCSKEDPVADRAPSPAVLPPVKAPEKKPAQSIQTPAPDRLTGIEAANLIANMEGKSTSLDMQTRSELFRKLAAQDPHSALATAKTLPGGKNRSHFLELLAKNCPLDFVPQLAAFFAGSDLKADHLLLLGLMDAVQPRLTLDEAVSLYKTLPTAIHKGGGFSAFTSDEIVGGFIARSLNEKSSLGEALATAGSINPAVASMVLEQYVRKGPDECLEVMSLIKGKAGDMPEMVRDMTLVQVMTQAGRKLGDSGFEPALELAKTINSPEKFGLFVSSWAAADIVQVSEKLSPMPPSLFRDHAVTNLLGRIITQEPSTPANILTTWADTVQDPALKAKVNRHISSLLGSRGER